MKTSPQGFTLLEIVAVLALIALLTALVLPSLTHGARSAESRVCRDQLWRDVRALRADAIADKRTNTLSITDGGYILCLGGDTTRRKLPEGFSLGIVDAAAETGEELAFGADGSSSGASLLLTAGKSLFKLSVKEDGSFGWE